MDKVKGYFNETMEELRYRVTWPTFTSLQKSSAMVLIGSLIFALVVGVIDFSFDKSLTFFYDSF
jgi:preprotein translocase subunit SecE